MTRTFLCTMSAAALLFSAPAFAVLDDAAAKAVTAKAACNACHAVDKKIVGPAYVEIAKKYKGDAKALATLTGQVRAGGAGKWGQVPMPPNPPEKISDADLKAVVEWILSK